MDWKALVGTVAPWIGTALGGPLGGMAVEAAGKALGLSNATEDSIKQALTGVTPEQMLALKQADEQFQEQMTALGFKDVETLSQIAADDRKDARAMQVSTRSYMPAVVTIVLLLAYIGILVAVRAGWIADGDNGTLNTLVVAAVSFWVGTTHDSMRKTDMINARATANGN